MLPELVILIKGLVNASRSTACAMALQLGIIYIYAILTDTAKPKKK